MKKLLLTASVIGFIAASAEAATYPTFVFDGSSSSITVTPDNSLCFGCSLSASFSSGVDGASWTPTSGTDSWTISNFIDWTASGAAFGVATYDVSVTLAFSSPDAASTSGSGEAGFATLFGIVSGGALSWNSISDIIFAQGSILSVSLEDGLQIGTGTTATTGVTFVGNPISPIPLPASGLLLLAGISGFGLMRKRKKAA